MKELLGPGLAVVAILLSFGQAAHAQPTENCEVFVAGTAVAGGNTMVEAPAHGQLPYRIASSHATVHWVVRVRYAAFTIPILDQDFPADGSTQRDGNVSLASITQYGTGIYGVTGEATLDDGRTCPVTFEIRVPGSPFRSVLGLAAMGVLGVGGAGLVAMVVKWGLDANDQIQSIRAFIAAAKGARKEAESAIATVTPPPETVGGEADGAEGKNP